MSRRAPNLLTIPSSAPFLATLADALLDGRLVEGFAPRGDPLALASATVFLPTRRAGRLLGGEAPPPEARLPWRDGPGSKGAPAAGGPRPCRTESGAAP